MHHANSRYVERDRARIYYEVYGSGPAVIIAPGGEENPLLYFQNIPAITQAGFSVLIFSLRGHFQSECPPALCHPKHYVGDIEAILDAENIDRAALIGESLGGFGTMRFAALRPERAAGQVLMGSCAAVWSEENYNATKSAVDKFLDMVGSGEPRGPGIGPMELLDRNITMLGSDDGLTTAPLTILTGMLDKSIWLQPEELANFDVPTLILGGDEDDFLGRGFQRHVVELIPGARLGKLMDSGHRPYWTHPERFNEEAIAFLRSAARF